MIKTILEGPHVEKTRKRSNPFLLQALSRTRIERPLLPAWPALSSNSSSAALRGVIFVQSRCCLPLRTFGLNQKLRDTWDDRRLETHQTYFRYVNHGKSHPWPNRILINPHIAQVSRSKTGLTIDTPGATTRPKYRLGFVLSYLNQGLL